MTEPTDPIASPPTEAASPADTAADAANSAAVEPAVRTVYPAGWPAEVLDAIDPALVRAVEAIVQAADGAWYRLRPAPPTDALSATLIPCVLLTPIGEIADVDLAIAAVQSEADARGVWVQRLDEQRFAFSLTAPEVTMPDIADEPVVEAPARRRRVS